MGAGEGVDTLGRWLSHHLASQIEEARQDPEKESECVDLILKLWAHRASYPNGQRPLESFDELIETLHKLRSDSPYYLLSYGQADEGAEGNHWAKCAVAVDKVARRLISFCLNQAVMEDGLPEDPWLNLAEHLAPDSHLRLVIELATVDGVTSEKANEDESPELRAFSRDLAWLIGLSTEVEGMLTKAGK